MVNHARLVLDVMITFIEFEVRISSWWNFKQNLDKSKYMLGNAEMGLLMLIYFYFT